MEKTENCWKTTSSTDDSSTVLEAKEGRRPNDLDRLDGIDHFPDCDGKSRMMCEKCKVHLCITSKKNCFIEFHSKKIKRSTFQKKKIFFLLRYFFKIINFAYFAI